MPAMIAFVDAGVVSKRLNRTALTRSMVPLMKRVVAPRTPKITAIKTMKRDFHKSDSKICSNLDCSGIGFPFERIIASEDVFHKR